MYYHEDLRIPGICPSFASSRKQIRHKLKSRMYPRRRPQRKHLRTTRDLNFGFLLAFAISDFFAISKLQNNKAAERLEQAYGTNALL